MSIDDIRDGGVYLAPAAPLIESNLFLRIACLDDVYVKVPSKSGVDDYRKYVRDAQPTALDVRSLDEAERFERLDEMVASHPSLAPFAASQREHAHYLAVHMLQYERLRGARTVGVPAMRFGLLRSGRLFRSFEPVLFQERVDGTTLWDMFDFDTLQIRPAFQRFLPIVSTQLAGLLDSPLIDHVDWNIQNFVFRERDQRLFYVDVKPTTFVGRHGNEHNLKGLREYFVV